MNYPYAKQCPICEKYFIIENIGQNGRKYCYECSPEGRGANFLPLYHSMKRRLIQLKGGKCEKCGYNKCEDALHFHHKDPSLKSFPLSAHSNNLTWESFLQESEKCILLCANCHAEIHNEENYKTIIQDDRVFEIKPENIPMLGEEQNKTFCCDCGKEITKGAMRCAACYAKSQRGNYRPSREELKNMIRTMPFTHIAGMYGVSDKAIVKWCQSEKLPYRKKDINLISEEEWSKI